MIVKDPAKVGLLSRSEHKSEQKSFLWTSVGQKKATFYKKFNFAKSQKIAKFRIFAPRVK